MEDQVIQNSNCKMIVLQMAEFSVMYDEVTYNSLSTLAVLNHVFDDCFFVVLYFVLKIKKLKIISDVRDFSK